MTGLKTRVFCIAIGLSGLNGAAQAIDLDVFGWGCLDDTEQRATEYAQCQSIWNRNDDRCKIIGHNMHVAMETCRAKGVDPARIDAAMKKGFRLAGDGAIPGVTE